MVCIRYNNIGEENGEKNKSLKNIKEIAPHFKSSHLLTIAAFFTTPYSGYKLDTANQRLIVAPVKQ